MRLIKLVLENTNDNEARFSVNESITEFYSTVPINEICLGSGVSEWTEGKCLKLQESWYKIIFFKDDPIIPLHVSRFYYGHFYKTGNNEWPDIYVLAAEPKQSNELYTITTPESVKATSKLLYKCIVYKLNEIEPYIIFFKDSLNFFTKMNYFNNYILAKRKTSINFPLFDDIQCYDKSITNINNIDINEWKNMTKIEFEYWFLNSTLTELNEKETPDFEHLQYNSMKRIKKRHSIFLEELIMKTCHPLRILEIDNTVTIKSNKRKFKSI